MVRNMHRLFAPKYIFVYYYWREQMYLSFETQMFPHSFVGAYVI